MLLVPARMQFVLFHPLTNVDVSEADCVDDLLTSGGLSCSRGPSYKYIWLLAAHKFVTNTA